MREANFLDLLNFIILKNVKTLKFKNTNYFITTPFIYFKVKSLFKSHKNGKRASLLRKIQPRERRGRR